MASAFVARRFATHLQKPHTERESKRYDKKRKKKTKARIKETKYSYSRTDQTFKKHIRKTNDRQWRYFRTRRALLKKSLQKTSKKKIMTRLKLNN